MRINLIYAEEQFPPPHGNGEKPDDFFFDRPMVVSGGPQTTIRNIASGFRLLGKGFSVNDPDTGRYDANLMLFLPGHNWRQSWCRKFLFDPTAEMERFYLHPLVEVRQILDQLQKEGDYRMAEALERNCNRACFLAETPKQYFRLKKSKTNLVKNIKLAPVGYSSDLSPEKPYWERSNTSVLVKDHNTYDVGLRSQHLFDMLDDYGIKYQRFERYHALKFEQAEWLEHLQQSRMLVAWAVEETHGHTLHEAKALDVPIFTTTPNGMNYFSSQCGIVADENELYLTFEKFLAACENREYSPRRWMLDNKLDNISTCENLLGIFNGRASIFDDLLKGVTRSHAARFAN